MKSLSRYPLFSYFVLALFISWLGWIPYAASQAGLIEIKVPAEIAWLAEFGPTVSAVLITFLLSGLPGIKSLLKRLFIWRVRFYWYIIAVLSIPTLILISLLTDIMIFRTEYDFAQILNWDKNFILRTEAFTPSAGLIDGLVSFMKGGVIPTAFTFLALAITNGGLSEEIGWRGFALQRLQNKNIFLSSLYIGIMWATWHTGTVFWKVIFSSDFTGALMFGASYLFQYLLLVVPLSVFYTIINNNTRGSLLLAIIFHAFYNISISLFATAFPDFPMIIFVIITWILAIVLTIISWKTAKTNHTTIRN